MKKLILILALTMPFATFAQLVEGLEGASGSTVGPGGALYVTEGLAGRITRVDPKTGAKTPLTADGCLPTLGFPLSGAIDVAFIGGTAYALVTLVGDPLLGSTGIDGIYSVDGWDDCNPVADIGAFSAANVPDAFPVDLVNGLQFAMQTYRGGFLVTDGHHNRVLWVTLDGKVSEFLAFDTDVVPTGLEVSGNTVYLAQAGSVLNSHEDSKLVSFRPKSSIATDVASGAPLLVDVERGRGRTLYALSQGVWDGEVAADPAEPSTGALVEVNGDGSLEVLVDELNQPTSLEIIKNTAYVVTLTGEILKFDTTTGPPFGASRRK